MTTRSALRLSLAVLAISGAALALPAAPARALGVRYVAPSPSQKPEDRSERDHEPEDRSERDHESEGRYRPAKPVNAPGPLPVLGAAAAFRWSRRLRARVIAGRPG